MTALGIGAKLNFVDRQKIGAHALWHRLDGTDPVFGARRHDPLFAGDKRHHRRAAQGDDLVIDLARQKTQRQADHTRAIAQHPFNRIMRLAGICRAQNRQDS